MPPTHSLGMNGGVSGSNQLSKEEEEDNKDKEEQEEDNDSMNGVGEWAQPVEQLLKITEVAASALPTLSY